MEKRGLLFELKRKFMTREIITYLIAGVLTTLVNFAASFLFYDIIHLDENITTVIAWIAAVAFAYFINNSWVFQRGNEGAKQEAEKAGKFVVARLFTLFVEWVGIYIFVTKLNIFFWFVKIPLAVIVTILNYVFSKIFIFIKKSE